MERFTKHLRWLLASLMLVAGVSAWAQSTSTLTFKAACGGSGTADDGVVWTVTSDGTESSFDSTKGIHYGTGKAAVQYIKLTTSDISGTITKVVVNASTASGVSATASVTVGGSAFGGDAQSLSTSATDYTFEGSATGEIIVTVTKPSSATKALYVKSVAVTYTSGGGTIEKAATPTFSPAAGTYTSAQSVELNTTTAGATIYYTTDGTDPTTSSSVYASAINVSTTTTIKAIAVKEGMDNSTVASATYTIVNIEHAGTEADPYTVADAIAYIGTLGSSTSGTVYVTGKISQIDSYNSTYGSITYWISDDGTTNNQMEVYSGLNLESAKFSSKDDIETGKTVTVCGTVKMYNGTPEFNYNNYLVYYEGATVDTRTPTTMYFAQDRTTIVDPGTEFTITVGETVPAIEGYVKIGDYEAYLPFTTALTYSGNNDALGTVDATTGAVTLVDGATGTLKVTATFEGDSERKGCEGYYTLTVKAATPTTGDLFNETFAGFEGSGGRDDVYSGSVGAGSTASTDEEGWTFDKCGGASSSLKFGTGSANGVFTTRSIALTGNGTLTFSAAGWGSGTNKLAVTATEGTLSGDTDVTPTNGEWTDYTVNIEGANGNLVLTFTGKRGFIDDIKVVSATPDERTATTTSFNASTESYEVTLGEAFTAPTATLDPAAAGSLIYESSDPTVATVNANTGAVEILAAGTTTITAKFEGNNNYKPSQASYTITVTAPATVYTTIQQLQEAATSTSTDITFQMTDIYVTAVRNNQAWISDGTYGALIYTAGHGLTAGKKLNGTITGKLVLYNGATEITNFNTSDLTITEDALATQTKTIGDITIANQSLPVKFENVTYDATTKTFSDGTSTIAYYDQFNVSPTLEDGHVYNIAGLVIYYNKLQIAPLKAEDVVDVTPAAAVEAPVFSVDGGTYTEDQTVEITCATTGASIYYTLDGTEPTTASTPYTAALTISETTTLKAIASDGTNVSTVTTATYTINKVEKPYALNYGTEYYTKVTDLSQLENGDAVIIVNDSYNFALSTNQQTNNRKEVEFEWMPWIGGSFVQLADNSTVEKFILVKEEGETDASYYFYASRGTADGYIYAASSSGNQLKTSDTKSDNAKATITIENGDATIKFQGSNTRNHLMYNSQSGLFSCYTSNSNQQSVQLYVERPAYVSEADQQVTVADAQDCYKTFITPYDARFDGVNDHAYIVTLSADQKEAILKEVSVVPAGTPIIYKYETAGTHPITRAISGSDVLEDVSDNVLKVSRGEVTGDGTIFVLNNVSGIGFYRLNEGKTLGMGKCYIKVEQSAGVKFIGINFDGDATGIATVDSEDNVLDGPVFNLAGQRVAVPAHGLYIVNGKKVFIK